MNSGTSHTEKKFAALRNRLDHLGYLQALGIESLPLVERLFNDLIQTSDSLRTVKKDAIKLQKDCNIYESAVEPFKLENGCLLMEINKLKHQLITEKEKYDYSFREQKILNRKTDQENSDLRFLNSQYLLKVKTLENESREKSEKILELQEKNLQAVIQTPGGRKQAIPFRRQRLEISSPPPSLAQPSTLPQVQYQCKDVYVADIIKAADSSITKLRQQIITLNNNVETMGEEKQLLKNQVNTRDMEINRLAKLLENGRPVEAMVTKNNEENKDDLILHLRMQLAQMESQNERLSEELRHVPQKAEREKPTDSSKVSFKTKDSAQDQSKSTKTSTSKEKRVEDELWDQLKICKKSLSTGKTENEKLKLHIKELKEKGNCTDENTMKLEKLILEINQDKDKLSQKVKELTNNEKELLLEIDRQSRRIKDQTSEGDNGQSDTIDSMMAYVAKLESQREQYKEETRALLRLLQSSRGKDTGEMSPKVDNAMLKLLDEERNFYKKQYHDLLEDHMSKERRRAPSGCVSTVDKSVSATEILIDDEKGDLENHAKLSQIKIETLQDDVNLLSQEKEELLQQLKQANEEIVNLQNEVAQMQLVEDTRGVRTSAEQEDAIDQLSKENDQFGHHIQVLEAENASLQDKVTLLKSQLRKANEELVNYKSHSSSNEIITQLTDERNYALNEANQLRKQNNSLVQEYQKVQATLLNEKAKLEGKICEMEEIRIPIEKDDSIQVLGDKPKGRLSTVETEVVGLKYKVKRNENEIASLRQQLEDAERNIDRLHYQLREKDGEIKLAEANATRQTSKLDQLQNYVDQQATEINSLRTMVASLESERDNLNSGHFQKDFEVAGLHQHLQQQEANAQTMHATFSNMESYVENMKAELKDKDLAFTKLKKLLDEKNMEINRLENELDMVTKENKHMLENLTAVTAAHQRVGDDLTAMTNDKLLLQRQIQEYVTEVKRIQELLLIKENERIEILEQYQHLSQENNVLESQYKELEAQNSSVTHVLVSKDSELKHCQETISALDNEIQMHLSAQQDYHHQLSNLNTSVQELENELRQAKDETCKLREELDSTRDICKSLDETNHHIAKQLNTGESDKNLLSKRLIELQEDMIQLRESLAVSRISVSNLESLMINSREKEFRQQLTRQEMAAEVDHLRNRLKETEEKMENQCMEMASYKTQVKKLESDIDRAKRQLTNERFEKEMFNQEVKKLKQQRNIQSEVVVPVLSSTNTFIPNTTTKSMATVMEQITQTGVKQISITTPTVKRIAAAFGERKPSSGETGSSKSN